MITKQDRSYLHALPCDLGYKAYIDRNSSKATKLKKQILYICFRKEFDIDHHRKFSVTFSLCRLYSPTCGSVLFHCSPFLGAPFCFTFFSPFFFFLCFFQYNHERIETPRCPPDYTGALVLFQSEVTISDLAFARGVL